MPQQPLTNKKTILSPLRYPGSKRRLVSYLRDMIAINDIEPALFVEPFAGGASVSLQLLNEKTVETIGLVEKDPLVAAFWQVVFSPDVEDVEWLIEQIQTIEITVEQWRQYKGVVPEDVRERALACLFLNRTSFSGILASSSGPLGGYNQESDYKIDCRFPRDTLVKRIKQAAQLRDQVRFVWHNDWQEALAAIHLMQQQNELPEETLYYFDPPFFKKAKKLYTFYFEAEDHRQLRDQVLTLTDPWILSYDYCDEVEHLYHDNEQTHVELLYSASQNGGNRKAKEVILTNLKNLPEQQ